MIFRNGMWLRLARVEAWIAQGHRCLWCRSAVPRGEVTAEHLRPRRDGGLDHPDNIGAACEACNSARGSTPAAVWKSVLRESGHGGPIEVQMARFRFRINRAADRACARIGRLAA